MELLATVLYAGVILLVVLYYFWRYDGKSKCAQVVVVGDIGRSPRMQYHSLSLATQGFVVYLIGYPGSDPHENILSNPSINLYHMVEPPGGLALRLPRLCQYVIKVLWQCVTLSCAMARCPAPSHVLLQNPPAIPSMFICWLLCKLRGSHLVVDWHNYGYTILGLSVGHKHPLVSFSHWYEGFFGRLADSSICVTNAMREDLMERWRISALTMYDRPAAIFQETDIEEQHKLFKKMSRQYDVFKGSGLEDTVFTHRLISGDVIKHSRRPALLISSTSWTEDEDFSVLLKGLDEYEKRCNFDSQLPKLLCVITGKGPQKSYYCDIIAKKNWSSIRVCTPWLVAKDYPKLLGSADLGICLHTSSSGLDLPMKVVDMFGCCLPVCAINFKCLNELVKHEENGLVFEDSEELAQDILELLTGFPDKTVKLHQLRQNLLSFRKQRWQQAWEDVVAPIFVSR